MRGLLAAMLRRPAWVWLLTALVLALGATASVQLGVDLFPNLDVPVVQVIAHDPGTSAEDLELRVTRPIEDALSGAAGVERVRSTTLEGVSVSTVQFAWGTSVRDARQVVLGRLGQVQSRLPVGVVPRLEQIGTTLDEVQAWTFSGGADLPGLTATVRRDVAARLRAVPGVALVDVVGGAREAWRVALAPERLAAVGLTLGDVQSAIMRAHGAEVAGLLPRSSEDVLVRVDSRVMGVRDLAAVPVPLPSGIAVPLGSLGAITDGVAPQTVEVQADGVPAVSVFVRKQAGSSTIAVAHAVDEEMARVQATLPPGTQVRKFYDQSDVLSEARRALLGDLLSGALLAVIVLWVFLGAWRPTLAVGITIPLSLLATLIVLWLTGQSFNVITLAALTLAVGMIVDDAIVVAENVVRHRQAGAGAREAALDGTAEIAAADAAGTFTTVAAFLPLALVGGLAGVFLRPFGLTVSAALLVSLWLGLTLVPVILGSPGGRLAAVGSPWARRALTRLDGLLSRALGHTLAHRRRTLLAAGGLVFSSILALGLHHGAAALLPPVDEGALLVEYVLPPGVSLTESVRVGRELGRRLAAMDGVLTVEQRVGAAEGGASVEPANKGELRVKLAPLGSGRPPATSYLARLERSAGDIPGVVLLLHQPTQERMEEAFSGLPALFGVTISGAELGTLRDIGERVVATLQADPAITGIVDNAGFRRPQLDVRVDGAASATLGVDPAELRHAVRAATWGQEVLRVRTPRADIPVLLDLVGFGSTPEALAALPLPTRGGTLVPLGSVATLDEHRALAQVERTNGQRSLTILAEVEGDLLGVAHQLDQRFAAMDLPAGYSARCTGQYQVLLSVAGDLVVVFVLAALTVLGVLALRFGSLRQALWIMALVPVSLAGGAMGLAVTGAGLDISVAAGALTLIGIAVNNGIVLVDFGNRLHAQGVPARQALARAARVRLRPILATTLTTIAGLLPTALGASPGQQVFQGFAIVVIAGLIFGTLAVLLVLPAAVAE